MKFEFDLEKIKNSLNWKIFWMTFIAMFIVSALRALGIQPPQLIRPTPVKADIFDKIRPLLNQRKDSYKLKEKSSSFIGQAYASTDAENASAYVVIDYQSGQIIGEKDKDKKVPVASLTKIMTAIVALDLAAPSQTFLVSQKAANEIPSKIGVLPGDRLTLEELLNGLLLFSGNDAAEVIREGIDTKFQEPVFIRAMNEKAQAIGLTDTHFSNPQGFDDAQNFSSAKDLALLSHYALTHYPLIAQTVQKDKEYIPTSGNHSDDFKLVNWNGLLDVYPNVFGVKIGNTDQAGATMVVGAQRGGEKILAVLLGAPGILQRDLWTSQLLDIGFQESIGLVPVGVTEQDLRYKYQTWYNERR